MGLDGCALDEDDDGLRELRLFHLLGRRPGYSGNQGITHLAALRAACRTGRAALGLQDGGVLDVGMPADLLILDLDGLDRDTLLPVPARDLFFARATWSLPVLHRGLLYISQHEPDMDNNPPRLICYDLRQLEN